MTNLLSQETLKINMDEPVKEPRIIGEGIEFEIRGQPNNTYINLNLDSVGEMKQSQVIGECNA